MISSDESHPIDEELAKNCIEQLKFYSGFELTKNGLCVIVNILIVKKIKFDENSTSSIVDAILNSLIEANSKTVNHPKSVLLLRTFRVANSIGRGKDLRDSNNISLN